VRRSASSIFHAVITGVIVVGTRHAAQVTSESGTSARLPATELQSAWMAVAPGIVRPLQVHPLNRVDNKAEAILRPSRRELDRVRGARRKATSNNNAPPKAMIITNATNA
jgi:hypothetical protein